MSLALLIDATLGEPPERMHPVVWMGGTVGSLDRGAPSGKGRFGAALQLLYGGGVVALVAGSSCCFASLVERRFGGLRGLVLEAWLLKSCFAYRALAGAAGAVISNLEADEIPEARAALRSLVSRDRDGMSAEEISAATIESLAENLSDSLTAPLVAYALGGLPAAFVYRAINTADAMIGYRESHEFTGKFAARTDDVVNFVPARLTAAAISVSAGPEAARAIKVMLRDHGLTESPNAGWPMSAAAGALNVALEKAGHYRVNAEAGEPDATDARRAVALIKKSAVLCAGLALTLASVRRRR